MNFEVNTPAVFAAYIIIFFVAILFRYLVAAGAFYYYYYILKAENYRERKLNKRPLKKDQLKKEVIWSVKSSAVFALVGAAAYWLWQNDWTAVYLEVETYGWWYLPVSLVIISLMHETYYYWVHRWMHHPKVFRIVHKVHHDTIRQRPGPLFPFTPGRVCWRR